MPVGGGTVWGGAVDGDPMASAASHDREFCADASGRDPCSGRIEERRVEVFAIWGACKDITLDELRASLARGRPGCGERDPPSLLRTPRHNAQKRTGHAIEQDRPDVLSQRHA